MPVVFEILNAFEARMGIPGRACRSLTLPFCYWLINCACSGANAQIPCRYEVTVIQYPACGKFDSHTQGLGLNEAGDVVGVITPCIVGDDLGFLWTPENGMQTLNPPAGFNASVAWDVNDDPPKDGELVPPSKQVVGTLMMGGAIQRGFVWSNGNWTILNPPVGGSHSGAFAINSTGKVAGYRWNAQNLAHYAFFWSNGVFTDIVPSFGPHSFGEDINDKNEIVGWMGTSGINTRPFLWSDGALIDLGLPAGSIRAGARGINNNSEIVGWAKFPNPNGGGTFDHGFLWNGSQFVDLPPLPGYSDSGARDLNQQGIIVGRSTGLLSGSGQSERACIWFAEVAYDLKDFVDDPQVFSLTSAREINEAGQIIATGHAIGAQAALLLTPVFPSMGDTDCDEDVDVDDLLNVIHNWGKCEIGFCAPDLTKDGVVNIFDLVIVLENWS